MQSNKQVFSKKYEGMCKQIIQYWIKRLHSLYKHTHPFKLNHIPLQCELLGSVQYSGLRKLGKVTQSTGITVTVLTLFVKATKVRAHGFASCGFESLIFQPPAQIYATYSFSQTELLINHFHRSAGLQKERQDCESS